MLKSVLVVFLSLIPAIIAGCGGLGGAIFHRRRKSLLLQYLALRLRSILIKLPLVQLLCRAPGTLVPLFRGLS